MEQLVFPEQGTLFSHILRTQKLQIQDMIEIANKLLSLYGSENKEFVSFWEYALIKELRDDLPSILLMFQKVKKKYRLSWNGYPEIIINDIDCGQGLYSLAFLTCFSDKEILGKIKQVNLISSDKRSLHRALLYYSLLYPRLKINPILKDAEHLDRELSCESVCIVNLVHNFIQGYEHPSEVIRNIYKRSHFLYNVCFLIENAPSVLKCISPIAFEMFAKQVEKLCGLKYGGIYAYNPNSEKGIKCSFLKCFSLEEIKIPSHLKQKSIKLCPGTYKRELVNVPQKMFCFSSPLEGSPLLDSFDNKLKVSLEEDFLSTDFKNKNVKDADALNPQTIRNIVEKFYPAHMVHALSCKMECGQEILDFYLDCASQGNIECYNNVAILYLYAGQDLWGSDYKDRAKKYLKLAIEGGSQDAAFNLSCLLFEEKHNDEAKEYLQRAAELGQEIAIYNLAVIYQFGLYNTNVDIDYAINLYEQVVDMVFQKTEDIDFMENKVQNASAYNLMLLYNERNKDFVFISDVYGKCKKHSSDLQYAYNILSFLSFCDREVLKRLISDKNESKLHRYNVAVSTVYDFSFGAFNNKDCEASIKEIEALNHEDDVDWPEKNSYIWPMLASWYMATKQLDLAKMFWYKSVDVNPDNMCAYLTNIQVMYEDDMYVWERFSKGEGCKYCHECSGYDKRLRKCPKAQYVWANYNRETKDVDNLYYSAICQNYAQAAYYMSVQRLVEVLIPEGIRKSQNVIYGFGGGVTEEYKPILPYLAQDSYYALLRLAAEEGNLKAIRFMEEVSSLRNSKYERFYWTAVNGRSNSMYDLICEISNLTILGDFFYAHTEIEKDFIAIVERKAKINKQSEEDLKFICAVGEFYIKGEKYKTALGFYMLAREKGMDVDDRISFINEAIADIEMQNWELRYEYDDAPDYAQDTWDALTDGMEGDYPGGDVDYDLLGFGG